MYSGSFVLTPSESKRLIAKAVASLPEVISAKKNNRLIVANGTTNAYVVEELGIEVDKPLYTAGVVTDGRWCVTDGKSRIAPICFEKGSQSTRSWLEVLEDFSKEDVFIKGANAIDLDGNAGVLVADKNGGTVGKALGTILARGAKFIVPVGLEKLIPSVVDAASLMGIDKYEYSLGMGSGMIVTNQGEIITEIEALHILYDVEATMVSSGGTGGSQGAVGLVITGLEENVAKAIAQIREIKKEPALKGIRQKCSIDCGAHCHILKS